jgi:hypothetical protein
MPRPRTGIGFVQGGVVYTGIRDRAGKRVSWPVVETDPPPPGVALGPAWAKAVSLARQAAYDAGKWDPKAPVAPAPQPERPPTFFEQVRAFAARQTYESAPKELRAVERYLRGCPIADLPAADVRPRHGIALLDYLKRLPSQRGGTLGHSPIVSVFNVCERALDALVVAEVLPANPFRVDAVHKALPERADKTPGARARWRFPLAHVVLLTTSPALYPDRRALHAVRFFTGLRPGELQAFRVGDLEWEVRPFPRANIARAIKSVTRAEGPTKTGAIKEVPILPPLERALRAWLATGWRELMGRDPTPADLVFPTARGRHVHRGGPRNTASDNRAFRQDCETVGIPPRHQYTARHTLVRMLRDAGASRDVVRWATHAPPTTVYDGYADAPPWEVLCAEFAKLLPALAELGSVTGFVTTDPTPDQNANDSAGDTAEAQRNRSSAHGSEGDANARNRSPALTAPERFEPPAGGSVTGFVTGVTPPDGPTSATSPYQLLAEWEALELERAEAEGLVTSRGGEA